MDVTVTGEDILIYVFANENVLLKFPRKQKHFVIWSEVSWPNCLGRKYISPTPSPNLASSPSIDSVLTGYDVLTH